MSRIVHWQQTWSLVASGALLIAGAPLVACSQGDGSEDTAGATSGGAMAQDDGVLDGSGLGGSADTMGTSEGTTNMSSASSTPVDDSEPSGATMTGAASGADETDVSSGGASTTDDTGASDDVGSEVASDTDDSSSDADDVMTADTASETAEIGPSTDDQVDVGDDGATEGESVEGEVPAEGNVEELELFSFFVTSMEGMQRLSGSEDGFGGDLRYGEADGLTGADKICSELAEYSMPGAAQKQWRAFLSVNSGPDGQPVHAIDRIGEGPWHDRLGRVVAATKTDLLNPRPEGADATIINDLPNEYGIPNSDPDGTGGVDNHHVLTGSGEDGTLFNDVLGDTCNDWTSAVGETGQPQSGFSWPRGLGGGGGGGGFGGGGGGFGGGGETGGGGGGGNGTHWITGFLARGCGAGISIIQDGGGDPNILTVGEGGGYGAIYCFALNP